MRKMVSKIIDCLNALFLIATGLLLVLLYFCYSTNVNNWFVSIGLFLFLLCLGLLGAVMGFRRLYFVFTNKSR